MKIVGISFDHMHMQRLLEQAAAHASVDVVGVFDPDLLRMSSAVDALGLPDTAVFTDYRQCLEATSPDIVILCSATASHAEWVRRIAPYGPHVLVEKPFAASLREADDMIEVMAEAGTELIVNWPMAFYRSHVTAKRLIDEGVIGDIIEVHYYDGNRGPLHPRLDDRRLPRGAMTEEMEQSWWYSAEHGGGSLLDYLGYGVTLGTWFRNGEVPLEVTTVLDVPEGMEVDEHSVTIARYAGGLSTFQTRWGTFTDPWIHQPQPKCGFVIVGTDGTIASYDREETIRLQTLADPRGVDVPADELEAPFQNPIQCLVHAIETGDAIYAPLSPAIGRIGQQIVDSARLSSQEKRTVSLLA